MKNAPHICVAEMPLGPIWDARNDLQRLVGILGAAIYLSHPGEDDTEKEYVITALVTIQEKIAEIADGLDGAIKNMKITEKKGGAS